MMLSTGREGTLDCKLILVPKVILFGSSKTLFALIEFCVGSKVIVSKLFMSCPLSYL